jgi:ubiquitin C-terminal hydrolase
MIIILFTDLKASTSIDIETMLIDLVNQNYAKAICKPLLDLTTNVVWNSNVYMLRGAIIFHRSERCGLRAATGHYTTCALRSNEKWESYDDTKFNVTSSSTTSKKDIEL